MGCKQANETETDKTPSIPVITVKQSNIVIDNSIVAHIQALKNVEVRSRIRGYLEGILVDEGKEVKKGQPLFKLSSPEYSAEFTKAQATLARAIAEEKASNLEVERVELLVSKNIVAKSELILAESKTQVAKAAVAEARATVKNGLYHYFGTFRWCHQSYSVKDWQLGKRRRFADKHFRYFQHLRLFPSARS